MKKISLLACIIAITSICISQSSLADKNLLNKSVSKEHIKAERDQINKDVSTAVSSFPSDVAPNETTIGTTYFDLQSNSALSNRISLHPDGTIGAVWTYGIQASAFPDRGTGYNYYDGSSWGPHPTARIENTRCGWPSYDTWGTGGEINVSHNGTTGLEISSRSTRGTGSWTQTLFQGPAGIVDDPTWPRIVCSGTDHDTIHLVCNTYEPYLGQEAAMLYSRSYDGGVTWNPHNTILSGTGSGFYNEIGADDYVMAANGSTVAIMCVDSWYDLFALKSSDNGDTWTKTVIWEHPYPFFDWNTTITDTFFCVDNSASIAIGPDGKMHVVFGINRVLHDQVGTSYIYWPYIDGIGYWNEDLATFSNDIDALAPPQLGYAGTELVTDATYVGWSQDVDGDGMITYVDVLSYRQLGISTMPSVCVDDNNTVFMAFSSTTETYDNGVYNYKHIWMRGREAGVWGSFVDITDDITHIFDECIYPVASLATGTNDIHLIYQSDYDPGIALDGDHDYHTNNIIHSAIPKTDLVSGITFLTVSTSSSPPAGGTTTGDGQYISGDQVTIVATANPNYVFDKWTENDTLVTTNPSYAFQVFSSRTFVAHFTQTQGVVSTIAIPPAGGTTSGDGTFTIGDSVTVTASSNPDWVFDHWSDSDTLASYDSIFTFKLIGDRTLSGNFHLQYCNVTTTSLPLQGGSTTGDSTYYYGDTASVTASANPGYFFNHWTENDSVISTDPAYEFEITDNRDLVAVFISYDYEVVTSSMPPEGGSTSGGGMYSFGEEVSVIASTNISWSFNKWSEDDTLVSYDTIYTFNIEGDRDLVAHFYQDSCTIVTSAQPPEGGSTSGDGIYLFGDTVTLSAIPNQDWEFLSWSEDGNTVSYEPTYSFIAENSRQLAANFDFLFSLDELMKDQIRVYPIPSVGIINIEFDKSLRSRCDMIKLFGLSGNLVNTFEMEPSDILQLNLSDLNQGVYILQLLNEGRAIGSRKIILK